MGRAKKVSNVMYLIINNDFNVKNAITACMQIKRRMTKNYF